MSTSQRLDPVTFVLIKNALDSIVDDMALTVVRTAYSNVVRDNMDFSTGFCDRNGTLIAQGLTIPLHLGTIPGAMAAMIRDMGGDCASGDVWIMNDPFDGGLHLPDIFVVKPIFTDGVTLVGYAVTIAHHTDVGGRVAGGNACDSTEIYQEGLRIPPLYLYRRGEPNYSVLKLIEKNVRVPDKVLGDLRAQRAACYVGEARFLELVQKYGPEHLQRYCNELLDYSERMVRAEISRVPDGVYRFTDYIDDDGIDPDLIPIQVALTVQGDSIHVDFTGTAAQVRGAINSPISVSRATVYAAVRCALGTDIPNNAGLFRPISVHLPEGSLVNPALPAAVAARGLTAFRVGDAVLGALAQALPERVFAAGEGGNTGISIGGYDRNRNPYIYVEFICGAWGARPNKDGLEGITNVFSDLANNPVEVIEAENPLLVEAYELIPDSGGPGRFRGGIGTRKRFRFLEEEATLQVRSDRQRVQPYGLRGGKPGAPTRNYLMSGGTTREMPTKFTIVIHRDEVFDHYQAGGGGVGNPLERDPAAVLQDVRNGRISAQGAQADYGVVIDTAAWRVDQGATAAERQRR